MAGHSKWATTKRHKAVVDAKRGKIFSIHSKDLTMAARDGGKTPSSTHACARSSKKPKRQTCPPTTSNVRSKKAPVNCPAWSSKKFCSKATHPQALASSSKLRQTIKTAPFQKCARPSPSTAETWHPRCGCPQLPTLRTVYHFQRKSNRRATYGNRSRSGRRRHQRRGRNL